MSIDPYDAAAERIVARIEALGFTKDAPPAQPDIPEGIEELDPKALKLLYDQVLAFYVHLGGQLAVTVALKHISKGKLEAARAAALLTANSSTVAKTASAREALAEVDPRYQAANVDFVHMQALAAGQEQLLKNYSKVMDRVGRELYYKTGKQYHQDSSRFQSKEWGGRLPGYTPPATPGDVKRSKRIVHSTNPMVDAAIAAELGDDAPITDASPSKRKAPRSLRFRR